VFGAEALTVRWLPLHRRSSIAATLLVVVAMCSCSATTASRSPSSSPNVPTSNTGAAAVAAGEHGISPQPTATCPMEPGSGGPAPQAKPPLISGTLQPFAGEGFYVSSPQASPTVTLPTTHLCAGTMAFDFWIATVYDPTCPEHSNAAGLVWDWAGAHPGELALYDANVTTLFEWPKTNLQGSPVAPGKYFLCLKTHGEQTATGGIAARLLLK